MPNTKVPLVARRKLLGATVESPKGSLASVTTPLANTNVYDAVMVPGDIFSEGERLPIMDSAGSLPQNLWAPVALRLYVREIGASAAVQPRARKVPLADGCASGT